MDDVHPPLNSNEELWRFRSKVLLFTLLAICAELALHAMRFLGIWQSVFWDMYALRFVVLLFTCVLAYAVLEWLERESQLAAILALALGFFPLAIGHAHVMRVLGSAFGLVQGERGPIVFAAESWALFLLLWGSAVLASFYRTRLTREKTLRREAIATAHRAKMRALRYRLNPHFLFNTLNSIGLLALEKRKHEAETLISRLATFLRASLRKDVSGYHSLAAEFAQADDYLQIEQVRFPDRLSTKVDLPKHLENAAVPPFLIQPLIELAIGEGVSRSPGPVTLEIRAIRDNETLQVELGWRSEQLADDGPPNSVAGLPDLTSVISEEYDLAVENRQGGMLLKLRGALRYIVDTESQAASDLIGEPPLATEQVDG